MNAKEINYDTFRAYGQKSIELKQDLNAIENKSIKFNGGNKMENENEFEKRFEKGMRDLRTLHETLEKVYFGNIECYLEEMIRRYKDGEFGCHQTDKDLCDYSNYTEALDSFRNFKPVFQQFVIALRKLPNFK